MKFSEGERIKDSRRAMNSHIVKKVSPSNNPTTYCGKLMFHATLASKKMNTCRRCKDLVDEHIAQLRGEKDR